MISILRKILVIPQIRFIASCDALENSNRETVPERLTFLTYKGVAIGTLTIAHAICFLLWIETKGWITKKYIAQSYEETKRAKMFYNWADANRIDLKLSSKEKYYYLKRLKRSLQYRAKKDWDIEPWNLEKVYNDIKLCDQLMEDVYRDAMILGLANIKE